MKEGNMMSYEMYEDFKETMVKTIKTELSAKHNQSTDTNLPQRIEQIVHTDGERQQNHTRRQLGGAEIAAARIRRSREVHLYRSAVQHGQRKVGLQRQRERPENQEVAGRGRGQAGRGFEPPRQVALHDVSPAETAA